MAAVTITRTDFTSAELRGEACRTDDTRQTRRLLAIAMVLDGVSRATAAETCAMDRQTLRDWVHRFNAEGIEGLSDRLRPGRPSSLSDAQQAEIAQWVEAGPDLERDGVVRWRRADLCKRIQASFGVTLDVRTVGKLLHKLEFSRVSVRPRHPSSDEAAQEAFKKTSAIWCAKQLRIGSVGRRSSSGGKMKLASVNKGR
jgi:transposase